MMDEKVMFKFTRCWANPDSEQADVTSWKARSLGRAGEGRGGEGKGVFMVW